MYSYENFWIHSYLKYEVALFFACSLYELRRWDRNFLFVLHFFQIGVIYTNSLDWSPLSKWQGNISHSMLYALWWIKYKKSKMTFIDRVKNTEKVLQNFLPEILVM